MKQIYKMVFVGFAINVLICLVSLAAMNWVSYRRIKERYFFAKREDGFLLTPTALSKTIFLPYVMMPDGLPVTWILRTEMGSGPLALLKLRGFTLPKEIFVVTPGDDTKMLVVDDDDWAAE
ncbi:hypothetical protein [Photorhabdus viridis]|uniref:hypothetical protein n=1 Tax=Photorhabdus viridis TaxID=3163327 RepID=UPI003306A34B